MVISISKPKLEVLDTYPDFRDYWKLASAESLDRRIELWRDVYMKKYPELLAKQVRCYEEANVHWLDIAKRIFPLLPRRLRSMQIARNVALTIAESVYEKAIAKLQLDLNLIIVIYVGIGCGAGWATTYRSRPAVLVGLENVAEEKWHTEDRIRGLLCHEIGHLAHMTWRDEWEAFEEASDDPLFRLYEEGFAQRCEHVILGRETWHMKQEKGWLSWCEQRIGWLGNLFLKRLKEHSSVNDFFGSWFNIDGRSQTGYFLGHAFICELERNYGLQEIALFSPEKVRKLGLEFLSFISSMANV